LINKHKIAGSDDVNIYNFVNINIDDIIEESDKWKTRKIFTKSDIELIKQNIIEKKLEDKVIFNRDLYLQIRSEVSEIFEILMHICIMFKYNFIIESTGSAFKWNIERIKEIRHNYKIVLVYPYTQNIDALVDRVLHRSLTNGRVIPKNDFERFNFIKRAHTSFLTDVMTNLHYFYIVVKYDAEYDISKGLDMSNTDLFYINRKSHNWEL
jgi:hypothetical protein